MTNKNKKTKKKIKKRSCINVNYSIKKYRQIEYINTDLLGNGIRELLEEFSIF